MCEDGMMDRFGIQEVYGMHNMPGLPVGQFAIRTGPFFAATDMFEAVIEGKGGHAAKPHETIDPTVTAAHVVTALQTIVSRSSDPIKQLVVSVTSIESSSKAFNVIAQRVTIRGTIRSLDKDTRAMAQARLETIVASTCEAFGAEPKLNFMPGYPVMVNTDAETDFAADVARNVAGDCAEAPLVMGGEDFAYMLEERPGAYILVGNGDTAMVHHPEYNFDDNAIPAGCSWWAGVVETRMPAA